MNDWLYFYLGIIAVQSTIATDARRGMIFDVRYFRVRRSWYT